MTEKDTARAIAALNRSWGEIARVNGSEPQTIDGWVIAVTGGPGAINNGACLDRPCADAASALDEVIAFFDAVSLPFVLQLPDGMDPASEHAITEAGFTVVGSPPMMLRRIDASSFPATAGDVSVHQVSDPTELSLMAAMATAGFGMPAELARPFCRPEMLEHPAMAMFLATIDGRPAGCGQTAVIDGAGGLFSIATHPEARRRGVAHAVTVALLEHIATRGGDLAYLQSSDMAYGLYERLGFRTVQPYSMYSRT